MATLYIKASRFDYYDPTLGWQYYWSFLTSSYALPYMAGDVLYAIGSPQNLVSTPLVFLSHADAYAYFSSTAVPSLISMVNTDAGATVYGPTDYDLEQVDSSVLASLQAAAMTYVPKTLTVNGYPLSTNITLTASDISGIPVAPKVYFGTTLKTAPIFYTASATVASGVAVFQLTADGTSTGTALFPNGPNTDSLNIFVSDATASYQMSYALTNSNKTLTVTANKLTTANILTGILGQATANGAVMRMQIWGS